MECSPATIMGKIMGTMDDFVTGGVPFDYLEKKTGVAGMKAYSEMSGELGGQLHDAAYSTPVISADRIAAMNMLEKFKFETEAESRTLMGKTKEIFLSMRNPSSVLGESFVGQFEEVLSDVLKDFDATDVAYNRRIYREAVESFFDGFDETDFKPQALGYLERYKSWYLNKGGTIFPEKNPALLEVLVNNPATNLAISSPTAIVGNVFEMAIKAPSLYGFENAFKGFMTAMENGLFREIPELTEKGVYGFDFMSQQERGLLRTILSYTDTPAKNVMYYAGKNYYGTEGGGRLAVQQAMFVPRLSDVPEIYWNPAGKSAMKLMSYTVGTYKLLGSLGVRAFNGDKEAMRQFGTYLGMSFAIGALGNAALGHDPLASGITTVLPEPITNAIAAVDPDFGGYLKENSAGIPRLINLGFVRPFAAADVAQSIVEKSSKAASDGVSKIESGDIGGGVSDIVQASTYALLFGRYPVLSNNLFKKTTDIALDAMFEPEAVDAERFQKTYAGFMAPPP